MQDFNMKVLKQAIWINFKNNNKDLDLNNNNNNKISLTNYLVNRYNKQNKIHFKINSLINLNNNIIQNCLNNKINLHQNYLNNSYNNKNIKIDRSKAKAILQIKI